MNPEQLNDLRDIHIPEAVSWWPLAPGWWALFAFLIMILVLAVYLYRLSKRKSCEELIVKQALDVFDRIKSQSLDNKALLVEISKLFRRTAMSLYGREQTAYLAGTDWLEFLDEKGETSQFSEGIGSVLNDQQYREEVDYDRKALLSLTNNWLRHQLRLQKKQAKQQTVNPDAEASHA